MRKKRRPMLVIASVDTSMPKRKAISAADFLNSQVSADELLVLAEEISLNSFGHFSLFLTKNIHTRQRKRNVGVVAKQTPFLPSIRFSSTVTVRLALS